MKPRLVSFSKMPSAVARDLARHFEVDLFDAVDDFDRRRFASAVSRADALIGVGVRITPEILDSAARLRAIATISAGYDAFDVEDLTRRGIVLMNTPDVLTEATADLAFALILAVSRRVVELAGVVRRGAWAGSIGEELYGTDVHGKTIGIIGLGRIGEAVARRAAMGFGMNVLYHSRTRKPGAERSYLASRCNLHSLLERSDVVCITLPLTSETAGLIGANELGLMKRTGILINVARGRIVDERALVAALAAGTIRGAGLDVYADEPLPAHSRLPALANVVTLPHVGSATVETRTAMARCAADNLIGYFAGGRLRNAVNPAAHGAEGH
jgi:gluconate 2-dehydrogenase